MTAKSESEKNPFPYYVGVHSLHTLAHKHSRVCVMNIMGNESSVVTPVSHTYSGGNVVAGVHYGRSGGHLETPIGDIPVYGSVKEVRKAGIEFDTGVIYLPPAAVSYAVSELCAHNDALEKIILLTEKVSVHDARLIRYGCQLRKVDVFGANCLGIANPWDAVRLGGALGGDKPTESLKKGSVAIYSNSGNFCTTISEYLKTAGFGISTILSSGKDLYIHFALAEFLYCAENDPRTKAIVVYIEPGGYYEKVALDWIAEGRFELSKPIIACVTGRWKSNLTRACGHAGAMAGSGDDAEAKEKWFDDYFGVGLFDPEKPIVSKKGVRISSIQEVPSAVNAVMEKIGEETDFTPIGDLSLKPWFTNEQNKNYPPNLSLKAVEAVVPYNIQIEKLSRQAGVQLSLENMRNKSGASQMNPKTHVTELYGKPILELVEKPFASTCIYAVIKHFPQDNELPVVNAILNYMISRGSEGIDTAVKGRKNGCTPNAYIGAEVALSGNNPFFVELSKITEELINLFYIEIGKDCSVNEKIIQDRAQKKNLFTHNPASAKEQKVTEHILKLIKKHKTNTIFTRFAEVYIEQEAKSKQQTNSLSLVIAASLLSLAWESLTGRSITKRTAVDFGVYVAIYGIIVGVSAINHKKNSFWKKLNQLSSSDVLDTDFSSSCFQILFNRPGEAKELFAMNSLFNLTVSNGPGTLSAKGAKESVSAKNNISTAFTGFMTNTGIAHGGNGFEAIAFLMREFDKIDPYKLNKKDLEHNTDVLAQKTAENYLDYKKRAKAAGDMNYTKIPCVNHPVFKNKPVNIDPREAFIWELFEKRKMVNPFQVYYRKLVKELFNIGATKNQFCVNIDAVIATISLELFWKQLIKNEISEEEMQHIVFIMFLIGRMAGTSAEVSDHLNRGTDMDCRTPASQVSFVM